MLLLRPHHINCIFFYRGLGYNQEFVDGMNKTLDFLNKNPNSKIKLAVKCDNLCSNCPNKQNNDTCLTNNNVKKLDFKTLDTYNLKNNHVYSFEEIILKIYKNFDKDKFNKICNTCNWYKEGVCADIVIEDQLKKWNL